MQLPWVWRLGLLVLKNKMINLLPAENKIRIKKEYLIRIFIISGASLFGLILITGIALFLLFYLTAGQKTNSEEAFLLSQQWLASTNEAEISSLVSSINSTTAELFNNQKITAEISEVIKKLIAIKTEKITIKSFLFSASKDGAGGEIRINGASATRTELINYIEKIKKDAMFAKVDSPLSNFLKEENIDFNIVVELRSNEK